MPQMSLPGIKASDVWAVAARRLTATASDVNLGSSGSLAAGATFAVPANRRVMGFWANCNDAKLQVSRAAGGGAPFYDAVVSSTAVWVGCNYLNNAAGTTILLKNDNVAAQTLQYLYEEL